MWRILLLGLMQGLTEFLPVSSSGHLIVLGSLVAMPASGGKIEVALHLGTLVAIIVGYRRELSRWLKGLATGERADRWLFWQLVVASVPAAAVGYWAGSWITHWFIPLGVAAGWLATTAALWLTPPAESGTATLADLSWLQAFIVGAFQALALWPGLSRSGSTIFAARVLGLAPEEAARLSFYMAIPVVLGASAVTFHSAPMLAQGTGPALILGMGVAAISGVFAIEWVKHALGATRLWRRFGWYTLILALMALWLGGF